MKRSTRGFTLIELLVVIAIIAILAAILFPVFAQSRQAARAASSQSNIRQLSLGVLMYTQDYDEQFPAFYSWGAGPITLGGPVSTWAYDTLPYLKNVQIHADPMATAMNRSTALTPFYTHYGYNYTILSPYSGSFGATPWKMGGTSQAAIDRVSEKVMIGGRFTREEANGLYWYGYGTIVTAGGIEPPDCSDIPEWCFDDWGLGGNYSFLQKPEAGQGTGGVSARKALNLNFAMVDGHCKFMQPGQSAIGTNWYRGISSGNVHITNASLYNWRQTP